MSKWIDKELFNQYAEEKEKEQDVTKNQMFRKLDFVWPTPKAGTVSTAEVYEGRWLTDPKKRFTKKYYYHFWKSGEKWNFIFCPKTFAGADSFNDTYCPCCSITSKLYMGTATDKKMARQIKRKSRNIGNWYVFDDPRDAKLEPEKQQKGKVKIYEFPDKVESKLKAEITDKKNGLGPSIFDPGDEGYNMILKVKSTKSDADGNSYPDYSDSTFSRRPSALGTDKEIKAIMATTHDLEEYINNLVTTEDNMVTILKNEMLYDMVKDEMARYMGIKNGNGNAKQHVHHDISTNSTTIKAPAEDVHFDIADTEVSDDNADLLRELENIR